MTEMNIKAGWRGSGLWLVNITKPLGSKWVIKEAKIEPMKFRTPSPPFAPLPITFNTPTRSSQIRNIVQSIGITDPITRLLLRKIGSHLDRQNVKLAEAEAMIKKQQHEIEALRPKKKQKVDENPNSRFIRIREIIKTRERLEKQLQPQETSKIIAATDFENLCHEWQLEQKKIIKKKH